ncbi:MAG: HlyD family efflux transporter periplasmic adaptor subunit [Myxococcales bacterium]|nr:HlyD family efflux transporter periplasmic adaptor subunit [Myxococcales bacterium]MCB9731449.1 HlyD family efflux transporter periplasmic adaptor subunit [Deltaproteobacteria bacterium]
MGRLTTRGSWTLRESVAPWLLWLAAAAFAVYLYGGLVGGGSPLVGYAETVRVHLAPLERARVAEVLVRAGDHVAAGDTLALLDATTLEANLRVVAAERARVEAQLTAAADAARRELGADAFALTLNRDAIERDLRDAKLLAETRAAELKAVERELGRQRPLLEQGLVDRQVVADLEIRATRLRREVGEARQTVKLVEGQVSTVGARPEVDADAAVATATAPLEAELRVLDQRALALRTQRDGLVLRAPVSGEVVAVRLRAGQIADADMPVADVIAENLGRVVVCVPEDRGVMLAEDRPVHLRARVGDHADLVGRTVSVGPVVELPLRCRVAPDRPVWGREATIELVPPARVTPGQTFDVWLDESDGVVAAAATGAR